MSDNIKAIEEYPEISFIDGYQIEDLEQDMIRSFLRNFNPRSPRGERPELGHPSAGQNNFNPRSPRGERR